MKKWRWWRAIIGRWLSWGVGDHTGMINMLEAELIAIEGLTGKRGGEEERQGKRAEVCLEACGRGTVGQFA